MKEIQLSRGYYSQVDDGNFNYLEQFVWYVQPVKGTFYAYRRYHQDNGKWVTIMMHRDIMDFYPGDPMLDHWDHNGLNNQRFNLRPASNSQNQANQNKRVGGTSIYKGVCWNKVANKWKSDITKDTKKQFVGLFDSELEAAKAWDEKAKLLFGDFANVNFP